MPTVVSLVTDDDLKVEFELGKDIGDQPIVRADSAAAIMLAYTDGARGKTCEEAYEALQQKLAVRWGVTVSSAMTYMIVETCVKITSDLKKKHTTEPNSKS